MRSQRNLIFSRSSSCSLSVCVLFRCGTGLLFLFGAVERAVGAILHCNHVLPGKGGGAKGDRRQKGDLFAPLCQQSLQLFCAACFACLVLQQHAEFIAANAVAVAAAGVGFFDAVCDLGKADISLQMAVAIVDLLEVVHIKHHQHPAAAAHLGGAVQVAVLVQKPGQRVQLVPHLTAINIV